SKMRAQDELKSSRIDPSGAGAHLNFLQLHKPSDAWYYGGRVARIQVPQGLPTIAQPTPSTKKCWAILDRPCATGRGMQTARARMRNAPLPQRANFAAFTLG